MDKETIMIIVVIILIVFSVLYITGIISINLGKNPGSSGNIPEECKVPAGQDITSWKEHLGHHENTKYCLGYYK